MRMRGLLRVSILPIAAIFGSFAHAGSVSQTTLIIAAAQATSSGLASRITLTATVTASGSPVAVGVVSFCDASAPLCTDIHLLGTAQLNSAGQATYTYYPSVGSHSYRASFGGNATVAASASAIAGWTETGATPTLTAIAQSGAQGNATLTATVGVAAATGPNGSVSFPDLTNGSTILGSSQLGSVLPALTFGYPQASATCAGGMSCAAFPKSPGVIGPMLFGAPISFTVADFNHDGIPDLAIAIHWTYPDGHTCSDATAPASETHDYLEIMLGSGNGTFANLPATAETGCMESSIVTGDFNEDGQEDVVTIDQNAGTYTFLPGNGDGTFGTTIPGPAVLYSGSAIRAAGVGDLNGDGHLDVVGGGVLLGDGTGHFVYKSPSSVLSQAQAMAIGDFNGDGIPDVAIYNEISSPSSISSAQVSLFEGVGDGTFSQVSTTWSPNYSPSAPPCTYCMLLAGDFNLDGNLDLATANNDGTISVLLGNGLGSFTTATISTPSSGAIQGFSLGDFNGDGIDDFAISWGSSNSVFTVTALVGDGKGGFLPGMSTQTVPTSADRMLTADFNQDGRGDLIAMPGPAIFPNQSNYGVPITGAYVTLNQSAQATLTGVAPLPASTGMHLVTANYVGDAASAASISERINVASPKSTPTVTLTPSANPIATGQSISFQITVTGSGAMPESDVVLYNGTTMLPQIGPTSGGVTNGSVTLSIASLPVGTASITAVFGGDPNYNSATSPPASITVLAAPTSSVKLSAASSSSSFGAAFSLTATVAPVSSSTSTVPTGTVTFESGTTLLGSAALNAAGVASLSTQLLPVGSDQVTATYNGNSTYTPATSNSVPVAVVAGVPTVVLTSSTQTESFGGSPIILRATVTGPSGLPQPNGFVQFTDGTTQLGFVPMYQGQAAFTVVTPLAGGTHSLFAVYSGSDSNYQTASSAPVTLTITPAITTLSLQSSASSVNSGSSFTLTASMTSVSGVYPAGTIQFNNYVANTSLVATLGTATLVNGVATLTLSSQQTGVNTLGASYSGSANFGPVNSSQITVNVAQTMNITSSASTVSPTSADTISVAILPLAGKPVPTGTITVSGGGFQSASTALVNGSAAVVIPPNTFTNGSYVLTAAYSGDANYPASTGSLLLNVATPQPSFSLNVSPATLSISAGASSGNTFSVQVQATGGFTGTVTLSAAPGPTAPNLINQPQFTFSSLGTVTTSESVALTGAQTTATATLTILTTAPNTASNTGHTGLGLWRTAGGLALAGLLLLGIPARRWRSMLMALPLSIVLLGGLGSCGGSGSSTTTKTANPGTTPGNYAILIRASSGAAEVNQSVVVTVQ